MEENRKGYKGFSKGLVCRGKQYAENTIFEEKKAVPCQSGMHYCTNPFEVLEYYDFVNCNGEFNDFAEVEALTEPQTDDGKKFCTTKLKIGTKLSFAGFVQACVDFVIEKTKISCNTDYTVNNTCDDAQIGSSGYSAKIDSTGETCVICCAGHGSKVKAKKGSWITLSEWEYSEEKGRYIPKFVKTEFVDGEKIKEDTFYILKDKEFVEVE